MIRVQEKMDVGFGLQRKIKQDMDVLGLEIKRLLHTGILMSY